jgi:hypothetical protein
MDLCENKKTICIITYYGLKNPLGLAASSLQKLGFNLINFPYIKYAKDKYDAKENYLEMLIEYLKNNKVDIILWWCFDISVSNFEYVILNVNKNIKNIFFNWDEPFNWNCCNIAEKAKYLDCAFITCEETIKKYINYGCKNAYFCLCGHDKTIHNIILDDLVEHEKYDCDISICFTNLYENNDLYPDQYINRKKLVDNIYNNQTKYGYVFHIYGPEFLKEIYPLSYKGYISYEESNILFNKSKINICTHVICNKNKYLNERAILIAGSGGLLYIDPVKGLEDIFVPNVDCVIIDKDDYLNQIVNILKNYDKYYDIRYNIYQKSKQYTWDDWAKNIYDNYLNHL